MLLDSVPFYFRDREGCEAIKALLTPVKPRQELRTIPWSFKSLIELS
jgi:hypothetical protein